MIDFSAIDHPLPLCISPSVAKVEKSVQRERLAGMVFPRNSQLKRADDQSATYNPCMTSMNQERL